MEISKVPLQFVADIIPSTKSWIKLRENKAAGTAQPQSVQNQN
jgi:hypothetical protein